MRPRWTLLPAALTFLALAGPAPTARADLTAARATTARPELGARIAAAARAQIGRTRRYDPAYVRLAYPGGDVPIDRGVCTDVVVRALRSVGLDLQRAIREDILRARHAYGLRRGPDANIDHRRVPPQMTFFARRGWSLPVRRDASRYRAGDLIAWRFRDGRWHIGVVSDRRTAAGRPLIIHNIGAGVEEEDVLFAWPIAGHYRAYPPFP